MITEADVIHQRLQDIEGSPCTSDGLACVYSFGDSVERRDEVGCTFEQRPHERLAGAFDIRIAVTATHLACVEPGPDGVRMDSYQQPRTATVMFERPLADVSFPDHEVDPDTQERSDTVDRGAQWRTRDERVGRTTYDRLFQPDAGEEVHSAPLESEHYVTVQHPTVQLSFPCQAMLARETALADQKYWTTVTSPPRRGPTTRANRRGRTIRTRSRRASWVSANIAGYGSVAGEQRLFVTSKSLDGAPTDPRFWDPTTEDRHGPYGDSGLAPGDTTANYGWTVEPSPNLATDLQIAREDPLADQSGFRTYAAPPPGEAPPLILAQVVRAATSPIAIRILGKKSEQPISTRSTPIVVLQAPPTVAGLAQQADNAPEFGVTSSTGSATERIKSTRGWSPRRHRGHGHGGRRVPWEQVPDGRRGLVRVQLHEGGREPA